MAYSTENPPALIAGGLGGKGQVWMYKDEDAETVFDDADYITDAVALGMKTGDVVHVINTTDGLATIAQVTVGETAGTLSPLTAIT